MLTPIALLRFHLKLNNIIFQDLLQILATSVALTLSYMSLATEDAPLWAQMFNVIAKDTSPKISIQNGQENNTEVTDRNMQEGRPETQPTHQLLPVETVN